MYKAGTVLELSKFEGKMDSGAYREALRIVSILDEVYGNDRDADNSDGGFVLIAENIQDVAFINERYVDMVQGRHETVDVVKCGDGFFINVFFLNNNEFGINVLMPVKIAPDALLRDLPKSGNVRKERF